MGIGGGRGLLLKMGKAVKVQQSLLIPPGLPTEEFNDFTFPILGSKGINILSLEEFNDFTFPILGSKGSSILVTEEFNDFV